MYKKRFTPSIQETLGQLFEGKEMRDIEFQVTEACNLKCTYCYQHHKTPAVMTFELAQRLIDNIFDEKYSAITPDNTIGLILSFIGGEPFLQVDLMEKICDYTFDKMFKLNHPWLPYTMVSICSNGVLVGEDKKTQRFLEKYRPVIDMSISIDGCQELHDTCRVDFSGQGSYIRAMKGVNYVEALFGKKPSTKMTFAPANITYVSKALINLIELGYDNIPANCVFEPGWTYEDATIFYNELEKVADYIIDNGLNDKVAISIFEEDIGYMIPPEENTSYCGGTCYKNISMDYRGNFYPCIRYMESSLNNKQEPFFFGDIENGIGGTQIQRDRIELMDSVTRRSQSTDECFYCPIGQGCAYCSACCYEYSGSPNKRITYICPMHKARVLANVYYWNKLFKKLEIEEAHVFKLNLPKEECLKIIPEEEYNLLKELERR